MLHGELVDQGMDAAIVDELEYVYVQTVKPFLARPCQATGLDVVAVVYQWPKLTSEELARVPSRAVDITRDILESGGLRTDSEVGEIVAEREEEKWWEEFGEEVAGLLGKVVQFQ